ncbi:MAG: hypothetical protein KatS3mg051_2256 [Anaerolineae bacterium]|nr:MAG: hypothetical protein KatS3mg051_2256 [Anaerolineae bacterium]
MAGPHARHIPSRPLIIAELRLLLRELNISKFRLASLLGITQPYMIYRWFSGTVTPSALYLTRLLHLRRLHAAGQLNVSTFNGYTYWESLEAHLREVTHGTSS